MIMERSYDEHRRRKDEMLRWNKTYKGLQHRHDGGNG